MESSRSVVFKGRLVQGMLLGKPALRSERPTVMKVARTAREGKMCEVNNDLMLIEVLAFAETSRVCIGSSTYAFWYISTIYRGTWALAWDDRSDVYCHSKCLHHNCIQER